MRTNIDIDDGLMRRAMRSSGARTKRAVVEEALRLLIQTRGQSSIRRLRGKLDGQAVSPHHGSDTRRSKIYVVKWGPIWDQNCPRTGQNSGVGPTSEQDEPTS